MKRLNSLPNNVMSYEVLIRFTARKLHRMKFMCREWLGLISDRSFIELHLKKKEPLSGFFFQQKYLLEDVDRVSYISIEPVGVHTSVLNFLPERIVLLASCNGLLCCRGFLPSPNPMLYVCNPLNKEWRSFEWRACDRSTSVALAFDPIHSPFVNGITNFQVVLLSRAERKKSRAPQFQFDIYSSLTGEWTRSRETCECRHDVSKNRGIYVDGALYWLTNGEQILMFDPRTELSVLIRMPIPFAELDYKGEMCIGESGGKLCYVLLSNERLQVWILEDAFESLWDPSVSVEDFEEYGFNYRLTEKLRSPDHDRGGEEVLDLLSFKDGVLAIRYVSAIYTFDFGTMEKKRLCSLSQLGTKAAIGASLLPFSMTLAPL